VRSVKWRKWNNIMHRDLGYLCAGLTLVYAVSGVAVNHFRDWNPNFRVVADTVQIGSVATAQRRDPQVIRDVLARLGAGPDYRSSFRRDSVTLEIFLDEGAVTVDVPTGVAVVERVTPRRALHEANFLHLNQARGLWTYVADLYAIALAVLAVTGLFVLKGKKGITGRGAWLTGAGVLIPLVFLWLYL
jgi:hypothetical protein